MIDYRERRKNIWMVCVSFWIGVSNNKTQPKRKCILCYVFAWSGVYFLLRFLCWFSNKRRKCREWWRWEGWGRKNRTTLTRIIVEPKRKSGSNAAARSNACYFVMLYFAMEWSKVDSVLVSLLLPCIRTEGV